MSEERLPSNISRRDLLKKAGIGAAIVWSAPVLTSLSGSVALGTAVCTTRFTCGQGGQICGEQNGRICACDDTSEGALLCVQDVLCAEAPACQSSADCPPGWTCHPTTCCAEPVCLPACGSQAQLTAGPGPSAFGSI